MPTERDIESITATVKERLPDVEVDQWIKEKPTDDDGLWYFRRAGLAGEIQLESPTGNCPFVVESDGMKNSNQAVKAPTRDVAVKLITEYLASLKK